MTDRTKDAPVPETSGQAPKLGYLLKCFPRISETFILNEVLRLEREGLDQHVYSMISPQEKTRHRLFEEVRSPITYLPYPLTPAAGTYLRAHAALLVRHPWRYLVMLLRVLVSLDVDLMERFVQAGLLAALLRRDGITHLHAGFVHAPGSVAWVTHRITGIPFSLATHAKDLYHSPRGLLRRKLSDCRLVFTCTGYNVGKLEELGAGDKVRHVYHGTDVERFSFRPRSAGDEPLILSVGRLVEKKGLSDLVNACARLHARGQRFRCRIVGEGPLGDELQRQIDGHGLGGIVTLEGALPQEKVRDWYERATLFALPCLITADGDRDGIPNVLVEAAASGVPLVSTPVSGIPELVIDGETGLVVPPRDGEALAGAIERLLESPELRERLAAGARRRVEERFDLCRNARIIARELRAVMREGREDSSPTLATVPSSELARP